MHHLSAEKTRLNAHLLPHDFLEEAEETRLNRGQNLSVDCPIRGRKITGLGASADGLD